MPSITDHIDRLTMTMNTIKASASSITARDHSRPFTQSVLTTPLGDLIRDIDPSELGLFTLVSPPQQPRVDTQTGPTPEIARVEVVSATPLRKHPSARRRDVIVPHKEPEPEPEVFAEAALKYIDRYSGVRPMSRARSQVVAMLEHLRQLREEIRSLTTSLKTMEAPGQALNSQSPKSLVAKEEKKIQELQISIGHLRKRKEALQNDHSVYSAPVSLGPPNTAASDPQEDSFWITPGARRTLQLKNDLLVHEHVDLENVTSSFSSPVVHFKASEPLSIPTDSLPQQEMGPTDTIPENFSALEDAFNPTTEAHGTNSERTGQVDHHHPTQSLPRSVPLPTSEPSTPVVNTEQVTSSSTAENLGHTHSAKKVRITTDVERIVSKIWSTAGDLIMPGNSFSKSGSGGSRPLRAKETIAHLHSLATQDPLPASPTASPLSSTTMAAAQSPTSQQVLTAHLLISLLEATPQYALPLAKVKEILSARGDNKGVSAIGGGASVRILYGCVAKRLLRIDRGGGEQIVRFDV